MDIPNKVVKKKLTKTRLLLIATLGSVSFFVLSQMSTRNETVKVERSSLVYGEVIRGDLIRDVRASGTLQPTKLRWIAASSNGRVEQILVQPGTKVQADSSIMLLSNPTLVRDVAVAQNNLQVAKAQLIALEKRLESNLLTQEAVVAEYDSLFQNANFRLEADKTLFKKGAVAGLDAKENRLIHGQLENRLLIEKRRKQNLIELHKAELQAERALLDKAQSELKLQQSLVDDLNVKAGLSGILQQVPVEQGQQLNAGVILARVAQEDSFKAELNVQESQVKNVLIGQEVLISAGGQKVKGSVQRIEPAVQNGVVVVDVIFSNEGLKGARPDLRVDGLIIVERLQNILLVQRPVFTEDNFKTDVYRVNQDSNNAEATAVQFGSASLDKIQIVDGLVAGDKIIISDTAKFNSQNKVRLD